MKPNSFFLAVARSRRPKGKVGLSSKVVADAGLVAVALALLLQCGSVAAGSTGMTMSSLPALTENTRLRLGQVALAPEPRPANLGFDKAKGQIAYASEWAGAAAANVLEKSTSEPILDLPVGVATTIAAPIVAVKDSMAARKRVAPEKLTQAETRLVKAMQEMAEQRHFHDCLMKAASEQSKGCLVKMEEPRADAAGGPVPEAVLMARVEELWLERTASGDTSYRLRIKVRIRLLRSSDQSALYDQPGEWRSGKCLFLDWTLDDAFLRVAETGYRLLADECVNRLLSTSDRRLLAGAGNPKEPACTADTRAALPEIRPAANSVSVRPVSYVTSDTATLGIYSSGTVAHVVLQRPLTRDEATSEAFEDVNYWFGDLIRYPNLCVVLPAAAVATPYSLYKQGAALVRGISPRILQETDAKLTYAVKTTRPHEALATQVAQRLEQQTSQPVMVVRQPLPQGAETDPELRQIAARGTFAVLTGSQTPASCLRSQGAETALEIHVESARLCGKEGINPKLALVVEARATLLDSSNGRQLYSCPVEYRSKARHFTSWASHDARLFREELQKCHHDLSEAIVNRLVGRGVVPPHPRLPPVVAHR